MRKLSIAVLACVIALLVALTGCGGGGGGGGTKGGDPVSGNTIVIGRVVDNRTPAQGVDGVVITLGGLDPVTTSNGGRFSIDLKSKSAVLSLFGDPSQAYFIVSTAMAGPDYPQVNVYYGSNSYEQIADKGGASIPIPFEVLLAEGKTADLGTIVVRYNDPNIPPPPPF